MSKYIDVDKLIPEIERYENTAIDAYNPHGEDADFWHGKVVACEDLKTLVTSLQQEQPEFPTTDEEVEKFLDTAPNVELPKKYENPDWLFKKQEQPKVELEKYIENEINHYGLSLYEASYGTFSASQIDRIIRNAFELGLNARKEK